MMRRFGVTSNTMNAVLRRLKGDGFVRAAGRDGTFVVDRPPHLCRIGLVFRGHPGGPVPQDWSNYWTLIEQEARRLGARRGLDVVSYYGVTSHADEPDYQRLIADARAGRLAGLLVIYPLGSDFSYDFADFRGPIVALSESHPAHALTLDNDRWSLVGKAARHFAETGRRRVAWIGETQHEPLRKRLTSLRVNGGTAADLFPDDVAVALNASSRVTAAPIVRLLMRQERRFRPDAMLILDDHLVEHAVRGLAEAGARVPRDVEVVAHCNYPSLPHTPMPLRWLGFDAADLVTRAFDTIAAGRQANSATALKLLPPLWEEEWRSMARAREAGIGYAMFYNGSLAEPPRTARRPSLHGAIPAVPWRVGLRPDRPSGGSARGSNGNGFGAAGTGVALSEQG
jgi:DNA-binding LacI/PurR family transcriptional regulator